MPNRNAHTVPTYAHAPATTTVRPPTGDNKAYKALTKKELAALRLAHEQEHERVWIAVMQQKRMEDAFREIKEREVLRAEKEREAVGKENKDALRRALEEEEGYFATLQRVLRQQKRREAELRAKEEAARVERERVARKFWELEEAARVDRESEARKFWELEEAAIERAVKESMVSEDKKKLAEQEEKEKRRVERVRKEAERAKRHVDGKKGRGWAGNGRTTRAGEDTGVYGLGLPLSAQGRGSARAFVEDELSSPPYSPTAGSDSSIYAGGNQELLDFFPEPTWYRPAPHLVNNSPRHGTFEGDTQDSARWDRRLGLGWPDETEPTVWRNTGMHAQRWRETKTERWETVVRCEEECRDTFQGYKEVTETTRRRV